MGILKGKSSPMVFDRFANLKNGYGNIHFWCKKILCRESRAK
ncbi:MAG: hypothetical protein KHZ95_03865 [Eubacterium sp.]|nr:hypothetical protein [Eubacterium sp.]